MQENVNEYDSNNLDIIAVKVILYILLAIELLYYLISSSFLIYYLNSSNNNNYPIYRTETKIQTLIYIITSLIFIISSIGVVIKNSINHNLRGSTLLITNLIGIFILAFYYNLFQ